MSDKAIRTMTGMVVSCNSDKTAVAKIDRTFKHPKLGKIINELILDIFNKLNTGSVQLYELLQCL